MMKIWFLVDHRMTSQIRAQVLATILRKKRESVERVENRKNETKSPKKEKYPERDLIQIRPMTTKMKFDNLNRKRNPRSPNMIPTLMTRRMKHWKKFLPNLIIHHPNVILFHWQRMNWKNVTGKKFALHIIAAFCKVDQLLLCCANSNVKNFCYEYNNEYLFVLFDLRIILKSAVNCNIVHITLNVWCWFGKCMFIIIVAKIFLSRIDWNDLCFFPNIDTKNTRVNYQTFQWRKTFLARMHADQVDLLKLARIKLNFTTLCITCKFYFSIFSVLKSKAH